MKQVIRPFIKSFDCCSLDAATLKFITSIAGLAASIVFSLTFRGYMSSFAGDVDKFCSVLEQRLDFVTTTQIAEQSRVELEVQTKELQRFSTDLAVSIADALEQKINAGHLGHRSIPSPVQRSRRS